MRELKITFRGGPLDGMTRRTTVPDRWHALRVEERRAGRYHSYFAPLDPDSDEITLVYRGCETAEVGE